MAMLFALGAVSAAIDAFQSLRSSTSSSVKTGFGQSATAAFEPTGGAANPTAARTSPGSRSGTYISPATMSALLAAQGQSSGAPTTTSASSALQDLFSQIDGNGDGQISKPEFESSLGAGGTNLAQTDDVFGKLDTSGDGSVSLDEMTSALKSAGKHGHAHRHSVASSDGSRSADGSSDASGGSSSDSLLAALDSSTSITNSDGSVTTTATLADGTRVTLTSPPSSSTSSAASWSYNLMGQAIQREAKAISASAAQSLSVSV
jgi:hypothetical protein